MSCRRHTINDVMRLLHKTHMEVHEILQILSSPEDFSREDASVRANTARLHAARKRIPKPQSNQPTKGDINAS
jgi:hypothetical protein